MKRRNGMGAPKRISEKRSENITATGIVIGSEWDDNGNPTMVSISTHDEREFIVDARTKKGRELKRFLRRKVQVTGRIIRTSDDREMIAVSDFKIFKDPPFFEKDQGFVEFRV